MSSFVAELIGTMTLTTLGCGEVAGSVLKFSKGENGGLGCRYKPAPYFISNFSYRKTA